MSLGNNSYFHTFIDDFSRMCWVFFIKHKDETFRRFKEFTNHVDNQSRRSIKCLRTDKGGEFVFDEFLQYCRDFGIKRQMTTAYTPQQYIFLIEVPLEVWKT